MSVHCGNPQCNSNGDGLKMCGSCNIVAYCSKSCQKCHWRSHKKLCGFATKFKCCDLLNSTQKAALNRISYDLPAIDIEYHSRFPTDGIYIAFIRDGLRAIQNMVLDNITNLETKKFIFDDVFKRYGYIGPEIDDFLENCELGDIFKSKPYRSYEPNAPQQFRNSPLPEPAIMMNGTVVIEIGFVDFGIILDSIESLDKGSRGGSEGPLIVIGYEMEPLCVAKCLVMLAMMKDASIHARSVVEVWLSSLWSEATYEAFQRSLNTVRKFLTAEYPSKVHAILDYWAAAEKISREYSLNFQLKAVLKSRETNFSLATCNLASAADRVDYLRYHRTKALYEDSTTTVGSAVMNCVCESIGIKQHFGDCVRAAPAYIHSALEKNQIVSFFGRIKDFFVSRIEQLSSHIRRGTVRFIPKLEKISIDNERVMQEIRSLNPYMISWSNVIDYIEPKEFHAIARRISGPDTAHVMHSCNWTQRVNGTDIHDIDTNLALFFYASGLNLIEMGHSRFIGLTSQGVYHYRDVCSMILGRRYVRNYLRYFFEGQSVNCGCLNGVTPLKIPSCFTHNMTTAFFVFAYKETGVNFSIDTYDLEKREEEND